MTKTMRITSIMMALLLVAGIIFAVAPQTAMAAAAKPAKVTKVTAFNMTYKSTMVSWKKVSGVKGYYIYTSASKHGKYKKVKTVASKYNAAVVKNTSGKTHYYKVCAYVRSCNKIIKGRFSSPVKGKTISKKVTTAPDISV